MKFKFLTIKRTIIVTFTFMAALMIAACEVPEEIVFAQGDWDSNVFHDEVAKFIIENGYGVDTRSVSADTAIMITSLRAEDVDVAMEIWSDNIPSYRDDLANGDYVRLGTNFDDNAQGLYIPRYLQEEYPGLVSVHDLADYAHLFEHPEGGDLGILYGGPEGWAATEFLHQKHAEYGLDAYLDFRTIDSNAILSATLSDAYTNGEPWVGYNWEPTWIMGMYDMVLLEDSEYNEEDFAKGIGAFPSVSVDIVIRNGFEEKYPEITEFLRNYQSTSDLTSEALGYMAEIDDQDGQATAIWFLENYQDIWSEWVTEDALNNVLDALNNQ